MPCKIYGWNILRGGLCREQSLWNGIFSDKNEHFTLLTYFMKWSNNNRNYMSLSFNTMYLTMCDLISQRLCCTKRGSRWHLWGFSGVRASQCNNCMVQRHSEKPKDYKARWATGLRLAEQKGSAFFMMKPLKNTLFCPISKLLNWPQTHTQIYTDDYHFFIRRTSPDKISQPFGHFWLN